MALSFLARWASHRRNSSRISAPGGLLRLEFLEDRRLLSVTVGNNFTGMGFPNTAGYVPPDTIAAAGPTAVVEAVNTELAIYDKTGKPIGSPQPLTTFFSSVMQGNQLSDPFVIYDEAAGRFVVGVLDLSISSQGAVTSDRFLFAVSDSSDPTNGFTEMHAINMTQSTGRGTVFADYPRVGWKADAIVVSFNMFTTGSANFYDHASVLTVNTSTVIDKINSTLGGWVTNLSSSDFTLAPATMHGSNSGGPMYLVEEAPQANAISVLTETNLTSPTSPPVFTSTVVSLPPGANYTAPPNAAQKGASTQIQTNDSRILNAEWRNNRLVAAQTVGLTTDSLAHARWYEFSTAGASPTLTQQGTLNNGANTFFPSIAIAANGGLGMTFIESSPSEFMSMYVTGQAVGDPLGLMQTPLQAQAGAATYTAFDGAPYRAGDYSGITVDPANPNTFWAANEYATTGTNNWGTWISNFTLAPQGTAHDVAVTGISAPGTVVVGNTASVMVSVANLGNVSETIAVSLSDTPMTGGVAGAVSAPQLVTLAAGASGQVMFTWNTSGAATGSHTLKATATLPAGETDGNLANNSASTTSTLTPVNVVTVASISPNALRRGTFATFTIRGSGFASGARVTFVNGSGPAPTASNIRVSTDGTTITLTVSISRRATVSTWDVRVTNTNTSTGVLSKAFTVTTVLPSRFGDTFRTANGLPHSNPDYPILLSGPPTQPTGTGPDSEQKEIFKANGTRTGRSQTGGSTTIDPHLLALAMGDNGWRSAWLSGNDKGLSSAAVDLLLANWLRK